MIKFTRLIKKHIIFYLSMSYILLFLFACTKQQHLKQEPVIFKYNEHKNITSLDPAFARNSANIWPANQLFNGLVQLDESLNVMPEIAKKWTINDSSHLYSFILRDDVYFHKSGVFGSDSTRTVNAHDFVYSFNRLKDKAIASPGSWVLQNVAEYYALNDSVFNIKLKKAFPAFLGLLSMRYCAVVPKEAIDYYGSDFRANPIGTGPFKFKLWKENIKLVLRKNELYFETDKEGNALPYLDAVAITFLPEKQSEFMQFAQGNIDVIIGLDTSYKDELLTVNGHLRERYADRVKLLTAPFLNTEYLGFYMKSSRSEVQSKLLRQAINYGFDRQKMITHLRNGMAFPAVNGFIPMGMPGFDYIKGYDYEPKKARALIEQYIKQTGNENPEITIGTDNNYLDICEYIQRELEKVGLNLIIEVMPLSTLRQLKSTGKLDAFRASWIADYPDAENYLSLYYSKNFAPNGPNYTHFSNPQFDQWYEEALSISNLEQRKVLYRKMDSLVISEAPIVPLFYDMAIRFISKKVTGLGINPQNFLVLKHVKKSEQ